MKPLKIVPASRVIVTSLVLLMMCACSSTPPQDDGTEISSEEEITKAATDEVPTDLGQPETYSYGFNEQAAEQSSDPSTDPIEKEKVVENTEQTIDTSFDQPIEKPIKKHKRSRQKRILSQENTPAPATVSEAEPAPVEQPVEAAPQVNIETPPANEPPPAYEPPPTIEQPVAQVPVEAPTPFYRHKFFIPGVVIALLALFFLFRKKRKY